MDVRPPRSVDEYRAGEEVIARAWRTAFDEIVSRAALDRVSDVGRGSELADRYRRLRRSDDAVALIARDGDRVVGTTSVAWGRTTTKAFVADDEAEIVTLYVAPDRWGEGIGRRLIEAAIDRIPDGTDRVVLETFAANDRGRAFYEACEFDTVGTWTFEIADESYPTVVYARAV